MRELEWVGSSKKDLLDFPVQVRKEAGHALYLAQIGSKHRGSKPLKGFGHADVTEICLDDRSGTYRIIYSIEFPEAVYVLHTFQKKSKSGIKTNKSDINLIMERIKRARAHYQEKLSQKC